MRACCYDLAEQIGPWEAPPLWIGSDAPRLKASAFVRGDPVAEFEKGEVYVVELWATWCAPCIAAFPHLSALQSRYPDAVTVIAVNTRDPRPDEDASGKLERIRAFVGAQGERIGFTVAIESDTSDMTSTWLEPAERKGLPMTFLIDSTGRVAWMGHPMELDEPLRRVVDGTWDITAAADEVASSFSEMYYMYEGLMLFRKRLVDESQDLDSVYRLGLALASQLGSDDPQLLNALAWTAVSADVSPARRDSEFALGLLDRAMALTEGNDPAINGTLAMARWEAGELELAASAFEQAIAIFERSTNENAEFMLDRLRSQLADVRAEIAGTAPEPGD